MALSFPSYIVFQSPKVFLHNLSICAASSNICTFSFVSGCWKKVIMLVNDKFAPRHLAIEKLEEVPSKVKVLTITPASCTLDKQIFTKLIFLVMKCHLSKNMQSELSSKNLLLST